MGKKEPSKGREWEKGRRDILNQTFHELYKALPSFCEGTSVSKKTILTQAVAYIHQLEQDKTENSRCSKATEEPGVQYSNSNSLFKWILEILHKVCQLSALLKTAGITPSQELVSFDIPPALSDKMTIEITSEIEKLGGCVSLKKAMSTKSSCDKKNKRDVKSKHIQSSAAGIKLNFGQDSISRKKGLSPPVKKTKSCHRADSNGNVTFVSNSPVVPNSSVMMQPTPSLLTPQLVFASSSSGNSVPAASLPLLVSVTGVKTVNPLIFVQSNVMTPTPSLLTNHPKLAPRAGYARPIQPGPPSKSSRKLRKVPIPSLRQKSVVPISVMSKSFAKIPNKEVKSLEVNKYLEFSGSSSRKSKKCIKSKPLLKLGQRHKVKATSELDKMEKSSEKDSLKCNLENKDSQNRENSGDSVQRDIKISDPSISVLDNTFRVSEVDKENVSLNGGVSKTDCDNVKASNNFTPLSTSASNIVSERVEYISSAEMEKGSLQGSCSAQNSINQPVLQNDDVHDSLSAVSKASPLSVDSKISSSQKRSSDVNLCVSSSKRGKCDTIHSVQATPKPSSDHVEQHLLPSNDEISSNSSLSKSNYSISALCAQQQELLQHSGVSSLQNSVHNQESRQVLLQHLPSKKSLVDEARQGIHDPRTDVSSLVDASIRKAQADCLAMEKSKESASDPFVDWSEKSRAKGERCFANYGVFSSMAMHNTKNSFIPINDMDNYKPISETFDSAENSFGLPLHSADISGDIFASLQVPQGGQHPESISPTAAFLLAFPLVSSSKATELLSDEAVCENADSQSGMKTILQIGNLDGDTPVTKCVNDFSTPSANANSVVYSTSSAFSQDSMSEVLSKTKGVSASEDIGSFSEKRRTSEMHKMVHLSSKSSQAGRETDVSLSKNSEPLQVGDTRKLAYPPRNNPGGAIGPLNVEEVQSDLVTSRIQEKRQAKPASVIPSQSDILLKDTLKSNPNHSQAPFLPCEKQSDWAELSSSQAVHSYADYTVQSSTRSDCAINFPVPASITSSSNVSSISGDTVSSANNPSYRVQPASGGSILSWSTLQTMENPLTTKPTHKLTSFQDTFPVSKASDKQDLSHTSSVLLCSNSSNVEPHYSQALTSSGFSVGDKLSPVASHFNQDPHISMKMVSSSDNYCYGLSLEQRQSSSTSMFNLGFEKQSSSVNFPPFGKIVGVKKSSYQSATDRKDITSVVSCATEIAKVSESIRSDHHCSQRSVELRHEATPALVFPPTSDAGGKARDSHCIEGDIMRAKSCLSSMNHGQTSKLSAGASNFGQSSSVQELKRTGTSALYGSEVNLKDSGGLNSIMTLYGHGNNADPKQNQVENVAFSQSLQGSVEHKKDTNSFSQNDGTSLSKQITSVSSYMNNISNGSMPQFNVTETLPGQQQSYKVHPHSQQVKAQQNSLPQDHLQQRQPHQQISQQSCVRTNKESSTNMMHRPPVNWMTAPDIRSHQHHNGPAFGNSSNMSATQGILYLPDSESSGPSSMFDSSGNFHCIDITHSGQSFYKGNELHLFGNESLENIHDNTAWSPNKSGTNTLLGNMLIPSTLPTLVGDLALGDNNISRPFLPSFGNVSESAPCSKKLMKRVTHSSKRGDKSGEDLSVSLNQECAGSFLSVSQLVDTGSAGKSRHGVAPFSDQETTLCQAALKHTSKPVSSNYSTEALLSSPVLQQSNPSTVRKRRTTGATQHHSSYVGSSSGINNNLSTQPPQTQFLSELTASRSNDYQGTFIHTESVPSFMLSGPSRSHRNHSYNGSNVPDRPMIEEHSATENSDANVIGGTVRQKSTQSSSASNLMDFGYMNMQPTILPDDVGFPNHPPPPPPPFLSHHSYPAQDTIYSATRLPMHSHHMSQNTTVQSPSATTLTNFHLSTIFPEINEKVIC